MLTNDLPLLPPGALLRDAIIVLAEKRGIVLVCDDHALLGVVTAGDLTRFMEQQADVMTEPVERIMSRTPKSARCGELASGVAFRMEEFGIMAMPVLDDSNRVAGVVHLHDLLRARVA